MGEMFVYHMLLNQALGLGLEHYGEEFAQLALNSQLMAVGNQTQSILYGDVIASALDVATGLVYVGSTLVCHETIGKDELCQRMSRMSTIGLRVDYPRSRRGNHFTATSSLLRTDNKIVITHVESHNEEQLYIASAAVTYMVGQVPKRR